MYALFLVALLATDDPAVPPRQPAIPSRLMLAQPTASPLSLSAFTDLVPYGTGVSDFYHRYRADSRWRGGVGLSFSLVGGQHRWSFTLGPVQFRFDGHPRPVSPP